MPNLQLNNFQLQEAILALEHSYQNTREKETENRQLMKQLDQSMAMSQEAIHTANRRTEEAHQRTREKEEENQNLQDQVQQLQEQVSWCLWLAVRCISYTYLPHSS